MCLIGSVTGLCSCVLWVQAQHGLEILHQIVLHPSRYVDVQPLGQCILQFACFPQSFFVRSDQDRQGGRCGWSLVRRDQPLAGAAPGWPPLNLSLGSESGVNASASRFSMMLFLADRIRRLCSETRVSTWTKALLAWLKEQWQEALEKERRERRLSGSRHESSPMTILAARCPPGSCE